jgi:sortase (surface protein transpeptidase)
VCTGVVRGCHAGSIGHVSSLAYDTSRLPNLFRNLKELRPGSLIALRVATRKTYNYRFYDRFVVAPGTSGL